MEDVRSAIVKGKMGWLVPAYKSQFTTFLSKFLLSDGSLILAIRDQGSIFTVEIGGYYKSAPSPENQLSNIY